MYPYHNKIKQRIRNNELVGFENFISNEIKEGEIAGAEVLIFKNNNIIWHKNLGYRNYSSKSPLKKNSIYYIQSMTKPIISVAIMQLIEMGLLKLDDFMNGVRQNF